MIICAVPLASFHEVVTCDIVTERHLRHHDIWSCVRNRGENQEAADCPKEKVYGRSPDGWSGVREFEGENFKRDQRGERTKGSSCVATPAEPAPKDAPFFVPKSSSIRLKEPRFRLSLRYCGSLSQIYPACAAACL